MKIQYKSLLNNTLLLLLVFVLFPVSCTKDKDDENDHTYLIQFEKKNTLEISFILTILNEIAADQPEAQNLIDNTNYDVEVYKITYSTMYKEEEITASGLVCLPVASESFPILSFQNGTNTSHVLAPSMNLVNPMFMLLQSLAGNGYIILIPDYIGFDASQDILHPYYVKSVTSSAVVDMIYAAREFIDHYSSTANYNEEYFLMGYSQGGWATLVTLEEIEKKHAAELEVKATSCGAGAYDLIDVTGYILQQETFPSPLYLPYYVYSHQQYGSLDGPMNIFFQEPYLSRIPDLFTGIYNNTYINSQLNDSIAKFLLPGLVENFSDGPEYEELRSDLVNNSVEAWPASSFIRFYHGTEDLNVSPNESRNMYSDFSDPALNASVQLIEFEGDNHSSGVLPWGIQTFLWFNEIKGGN